MPIHLNSTTWAPTFMQGTLAAWSLVFAAASFGQTTAPSTVKVGNISKQAVGTVTDISDGDLGCYLSLKDDQGKAFKELADFAICEKPKAYLGRRVSLTYTMRSVMADSCQGDTSCKKTRAVALVQSLTLLGAANTVSSSPVAPAAAIGQTSFCTAQETVVFSCRTGAKMVSVCASKNAAISNGYLQYRFGKPDSHEALELMLPEGQLTANKAASGETVPFAGGAGSWLRFKKGGYSYVAYSGIGMWGPKGETREKNGIVVERSGKTLANLKCTGDTTSELGPEWYEKMGVQAKGDEDFLFPD
ncbi:MAG: hypothetical protein RIS44_3351 [Pseudomonadota bacterium]|jgi:hypothetical protein